MPAIVAELSPSPSAIFALLADRRALGDRHRVDAVAGRNEQVTFDRARERQRIVAVAELRGHAAADDRRVADRHQVGIVAAVNREIADCAADREIVVAVAERHERPRLDRRRERHAVDAVAAAIDEPGRGAVRQLERVVAVAELGIHLVDRLAAEVDGDRVVRAGDGVFELDVNVVGDARGASFRRRSERHCR